MIILVVGYDDGTFERRAFEHLDDAIACGERLCDGRSRHMTLLLRPGHNAYTAMRHGRESLAEMMTEEACDGG